MRPNQYEYDAFISHAVEDKMPIANELCAKLERAGLKIWYSGKELGIGDSIEKTIQKGLNRSRYGIVIFSPTYLAKNWTIREFYTLLSKEIEEHKVILPVLYNITLDDLKNKDLVMADRFAVNADRGIDFVAERLVAEIKKSYVVKKEQTWFAKLWFLLIFSLLVNVALLFKGTIFPEPIQGGRQNHEVYGFERKDPKHHSTNQQRFVGEIQGLFNQLSQCQCNTEEKEQAVYQVTNVGFNHHNEVSAGKNVQNSDTNAARTESSRQVPGRKMTMALVFQMETLENVSPEQPIHDITPNEHTDPFLIATHQSKERELSNIHCSHASCLNK